ncbi:hypothetical protein BgiBS90_022184 [Biomphalaria glabrata]|nr:hypothetical protein BgiBS90_022184 [Biomphalaria glabrata]
MVWCGLMGDLPDGTAVISKAFALATRHGVSTYITDEQTRDAFDSCGQKDVTHITLNQDADATAAYNPRARKTLRPPRETRREKFVARETCGASRWLIKKWEKARNVASLDRANHGQKIILYGVVADRLLYRLRLIADEVLYRLIADQVWYRLIADQVWYRLIADEVLYRLIADEVLYRLIADEVLCRCAKNYLMIADGSSVVPNDC